MTNINDIYHNLSPDELWALGKDTPATKVNWTAAEHAEFEKLCDLQDKTDLEFDVLRLILNKPHEASLGNILIYCNALNIDPHTFLEKTLTNRLVKETILQAA
jgi:hypothetical protein